LFSNQGALGADSFFWSILFAHYQQNQPGVLVVEKKGVNGMG
jgi:hypothetical protein